MLLGINTQQRLNIPSFQTIDFKLSQNFITSRNPSLSSDNDYQPGSLTYTETEIDQRISMKLIDLPDQDKQNFDNIQIALNKRQVQLFEGFRNPSMDNKNTNIKMKRKKSVLIINNIELNCNDKTDRTEQDTKRSNNEINFKRIQKRSSFSRNRANSVSSNSQSNNNQIQKISESIIVVNNSSNYTQQGDPCSQIKKKSISCMKTQDKSIISSVVRSCSKQRLQRSVSERTSCCRQIKRSKIISVSDRYSRNSIDRPSSSKCIKGQLRYKQIKRNFLQDTVPLQTIMNVKSIKLQQNTDVSRAYLRKIIQNRVSIQHYAQNKRNYRQIRQ